MKRLIVIILLLFPTLAWGACDGSFTPSSCGANCWQACDASDDAVQAAVDASEAAWNIANEVRVPAGTVEWSDDGKSPCNNNYEGSGSACAVCMMRGVKLTGAGVGSTVVTITSADKNYPSTICFQPAAQARLDNEPFELSGFTIDGNGENYLQGVVNVGNFTNNALMSNIKIHDNTFNDTYHALYFAGDIIGVVYNNTFDGVETVIKGSAGSSWNPSWTPSDTLLKYGTVNALFFEDNTIINTGATGTTGSFTAGGSYIGVVYRYNTIDFNSTAWPSGQHNDLHGLQSMVDATETDADCCYDGHPVCAPTVDHCTQWSQLKSEWYGNIYANYSETNDATVEWMRHRGSWMLMFNNKLTGSTSGSGAYPIPTYFQYSCDTCQSPASPAKSQHVQNTLTFNNQAGGAEKAYAINPYTANYTPSGSGTADFCASSGGYEITENTDYFNYNASCSGTDGCTSGVGIGTTAPTGNCTKDAAWFFVWSQGTTLPSTIANMRTYTQTAKVYKCTDTNTWTEYYSPYTYPHPLRGTGKAAASLGSGASMSIGSGAVLTLQ